MLVGLWNENVEWKGRLPADGKSAFNSFEQERREEKAMNSWTC